MDNDFLPRRGPAQSEHSSDSADGGKPFRTPEAIASEEETGKPSGDSSASEQDGQNKHRRSLKQWLKSRTKKQWTIMIVVAVLVLAGVGFAVYHFWLKPKPKLVSQTIKPSATPVKPTAPQLTAKLTGLPITDASINDRPVTAVMIENSPDARPQSGLNQAGVVFEAVAEGGITRFLTLFQDTTPNYLGPVRSVRPYYIQWLMGFDAAVAHVGGSADGLALLKSLGVKDLDQFYNPGPYHRISTRYAPHNMYTDVAALRALQVQKGWTTSNYTPFARKPESKLATPAVTYIDFAISGADYNVHYDYDAATNSYKRSEGGAPHMDTETGRISPKTVVALVMPQGQNGIYTTYNTLGQGDAFVFQDGGLVKGTWHKNTETAQFTFTDADGHEIKFNPGQTWLTALGSDSRVAYK